MDIGNIAEKLTALSDSLWKWRAYIPLIAMTGICAYLMLENRKLNLETVHLLQQIIVEKDAKQELRDQNAHLEKEKQKAQIDYLQSMLNNRR